MISGDFKTLFESDSVDKQLHIDFGDFVLGNGNITGESMELTESLCSDGDIRFGSCEASVIKFQILNTVQSMKGMWMDVGMSIGGGEEIFSIGRYKVDSDQPTADRQYRDIVAYDAIHDILNAEVSDWYNGLVFPLTLKAFRDSFLAYFEIEQISTDLPNDAMIVQNTITPSELSGATVIEAICEINGCFGHINREGKFQYVFLNEIIASLYPANDLYPADDLFPSDGTTELISSGIYTSCQYEDYICQKIDKLQIRQEENDIGAIVGYGNNSYIVEDNFLVYGMGADELGVVAENLLPIMARVSYRPYSAEAKGNPCIELGDRIRFHTKYEVVESYILQRTIKGIQALKDSYSAEGDEYWTKNHNSVNEQIIQLRGRTNTLVRTVDETRLEIRDIESGLSTRITQNTEQISLEASRASAAEGNLAAQISVNAQQILTKVSRNNIVSEINQTAETIKISAQRIDLVGLVSATEFTSKYATIDTLNATTANLNSVIAQKATIEQLNATSASLSNVIATKATIDSLNAVSARLGTVEANYITAGTVKADYMEVANWTSGGLIKAERIDADNIVSRISSSTVIICGGINASNLIGARLQIANQMYSETSIAISGKTYYVLAHT